MKILCISGYGAWDKVSQRKMPSHHLFGIHEMIDHYVKYNGSIRGIIKKDVFDGGYVDFYLWNGGKKNIIKQSLELLRLSSRYDVYYDMLNRCSIVLGAFKKVGLMKNTKLITVMHHPPYNKQLKISISDAYIFFDNEYKKIAIRSNRKIQNRFFTNEWKPDKKWYDLCVEDLLGRNKNGLFIDNGKSRRDRTCLIEAAELAKVRVDYAGDFDGDAGWARPYKIDLEDDIAQVRKLMNYKAIVIPVNADNKERIGPLGITSYLDALSLGVPVIASDNVCFAKEVKDRKYGLIYKTGDSGSLADCMRKMNDDLDFYNELVENVKAADKQDINQYSLKLRKIIAYVLK